LIGLVFQGYYCLQGGTSLTRLICPPGSYCSSGSGIPFPCPAGSYNSQPGASSDVQCLQCPARYYCPQGSVDNSNVCPSGTFLLPPAAVSLSVDVGVMTCGRCIFDRVLLSCWDVRSNCVPHWNVLRLSKWIGGSVGMFQLHFWYFPPDRRWFFHRCAFQSLCGACTGAYCGGTGNPFPTLCSPGRYNPLPAQGLSTACVQCDAGWACPTTGLSIVTVRCRCATLSGSDVVSGFCTTSDNSFVCGGVCVCVCVCVCAVPDTSVR
jgi:hypothetical protein